VELFSLRDSPVGTTEGSGLSFEQKKRLSIAVELAASPSIIFLDEVRSHLITIVHRFRLVLSHFSCSSLIANKWTGCSKCQACGTNSSKNCRWRVRAGISYALAFGGPPDCLMFNLQCSFHFTDPKPFQSYNFSNDSSAIICCFRHVRRLASAEERRACCFSWRARGRELLANGPLL